MKSYEYFVLLSLLFLVSCSCGNERSYEAQISGDLPIASDGRSVLRLATYNVGVFNKSGVNSLAMVSRMMKEWAPDVISLNELDSCNTRSGLDVYQLSDFAKTMGNWNYHFASAIPYKDGTYGIGVVTPMPVKNKWNIRLPQADDREVRALAVVETDRFVFCSTHIGLTEAARLAQVDVINEFISSHFMNYGKPVFLCGDMNDVPSGNAINRLKGDWTLLSCTDEYTYNTTMPKKCIDYIFMYKHAASCTPVSTKVGTSFRSGDPKVASDHFPVLVEVRL